MPTGEPIPYSFRAVWCMCVYVHFLSSAHSLQVRLSIRWIHGLVSVLTEMVVTKLEPQHNHEILEDAAHFYTV